MEYVRKRRWANYGTLKCKEYLRNDFSHECAYCKLQEQEVGLVCSDYFEIDHFKPKSIKCDDTHKYNNLYYSCQKCNNEKSDTWSNKLLDPCNDDIFSGNSPAIVGGTKDNQHKYIAQNEQGSFYINTFKLNSRHQIRIRKMRAEHQNNIFIIDALIDEILLKFREKAELQDLSELIDKLDELRIIKQQKLSTLPKDEMFEKAESYLNEHEIENCLVFEEYNMDMKIKVNGITYYCELLVDDSNIEKSEYKKNLNIEKVRTWFNVLKSNFGVLYYFPNINRMYFFPVSNKFSLSDISNTELSKQIKINGDCIIA